MRKPLLITVLFILALSASQISASGNRINSLKVMTRNIYLGADVTPVVEALASDPSQVPIAMGMVFSQVEKNDFPNRARALAKEIRRTRPDLIGLQEVSLWRSGPFDPTRPATAIVMDYLQILMAEIQGMQLPYQVAVVNEDFDVELPIVNQNGLSDIRITNRNVILYRTNRRLKIKAREEGTFTAALPLGPGVSILRGWASVTGRLAGKDFKFITTHLEAGHPGIRALQSLELLQGPASGTQTTILVGDFNSIANAGEEGEAYQHILAAEYLDVWSHLKPNHPGNTCCQDERLTNLRSEANRRIDLIFVRGKIKPISVRRVGAKPNRRNQPLWASDHAGVVAEVLLPPKRKPWKKHKYRSWKKYRINGCR